MSQGGNLGGVPLAVDGSGLNLNIEMKKGENDRKDVTSKT
jgi:hypothetical protein